MCLLILKPSGVRYDHDFIKWSVNNGISFNRDGIGGAVRKQLSNTLMMDKGYFNNNVEYFYQWLLDADIQPGDEVMIHLRQGTAGQKSTYNQHPYILGEDATIGPNGDAILTLQSDNVETGVFAHNGIFWRNTYYDFQPKLSDSYNWALTNYGNSRDIEDLKSNPDLSLHHPSVVDDLSGQKVCFMFPDREMIRKGNFISDRGVLFSNQGYKNGNYNDRGGVHIEDNTEDDSYVSWWATGLQKINSMIDTGFNITPEESTCALPPKKEEPETKIVTIISKETNSEIKTTINTSFDFSLEVSETVKPPMTIIHTSRPTKKKSPPKIINLDASKIYQTINDFNLPVNINRDNKDHFILKTIEDVVVVGKTIPKGKTFFVYNCYVSSDTDTVRALCLKPTDPDDEAPLITKISDVQDRFQVMPKLAYYEMYKDYMKLVNLYGVEMSKNKQKKLAQLYNSISRNVKVNPNTVNNFYKAKYNSRALAAFYENFVKQDTPMIKTRQLTLNNMLDEYGHD